MGPILLSVAIASIVSFLCSLWEAALYSIPASRIESMREQGVRGAERLWRLRQDIDEPITAILTFNTLSHTIGATVAGALVEQTYGRDSSAPILIFSVLFSIHILALTEILPKTIGVTFADRVAPASAVFIELLIKILWPVVRLARLFTKLVTSRASVASKGPTEADILAMARMGAQQGTLTKEEALWASNALLLDNITVKQLMTPRTVVYLLPEKMPLSMISARSTHWTHSRLPLCTDDNPDKITGIVYRRDVFDAIALKPREELARLALRDLKRPVTFIPDSLKGNEVLRSFLQRREQFFIVVDEYGTMEGIITLEDVLEFLLGEEIVDPHDRHVDMQEHARRLADERRKRIESRFLTPSAPEGDAPAPPPGDN